MKKVELKDKIKELRGSNTLFDRIIKDCMTSYKKSEIDTFHDLPEHLKEDAYKRMKIRRIVLYIED